MERREVWRLAYAAALVTGIALCGAAAEDWRTDQILNREDFESEKAREGNPTIISRNIAPGLMVQTKVGVYRTTSRLTICQAGHFCTVPPKGKGMFVHGIRLYGFGRDGRVPGTLKAIFGIGERAVETLSIVHRADSPSLRCTVGDQVLEVPYTSLPADFAVMADGSGKVILEVTGLSDSSLRKVEGSSAFFRDRVEPFDVRTELVADSAMPAEVELDNIVTALETPKVKSEFPMIVRPEASFDPDRAGWKKVFEDEFEGDRLDETAWQIRNPGTDHLVKVGDGMVRLGVDFPAGCTNRIAPSLLVASLWSRQSWLYGYFEARVKFSRQNGWWAAFWLYGEKVDNPFTEGFEIDIFEDYFTRRLTPEGTPEMSLDHNLHMYCGSRKSLKSWNYNSALPGSLDDWHRIGCKWTPFEISYYLDGKLIRSSAVHSPWNSTTFDPFNHGCGTTPLKAIISCQGMHAAWNRIFQDITNCTFPDWYQVDRVSVWEYPEVGDRVPQVTWSDACRTGTDGTAEKGSTLVFAADVTPSPVTKAPLKAVYLFDNGQALQYRTEPPYSFEVNFSEAAYESTRYMVPGRQKVRPEFDIPHAFVIFAQDAEGRVGFTKPKVVTPVGSAASGK